MVSLAGRNLYIRFQSQTGDAMGMNMLSKVGCCFSLWSLVSSVTCVSPVLVMPSFSGDRGGPAQAPATLP